MALFDRVDVFDVECLTCYDLCSRQNENNNTFHIDVNKTQGYQRRLTLSTMPIGICLLLKNYPPFEDKSTCLR